MTADGSINKEYLAALPSSETPAVQTSAQIESSAALLQTEWPKVIG